MPDINPMYAHLEAVANAIPDPIFIMGQDGTYLDVIGGKERSLYADANPLIGKKYSEVLPTKLAKRFLHVVQTSISEKRLVEIEYQLSNEEVQGIDIGSLPKKGQWYEARIYPIAENTYNQPAVIWLSINIDTRKQIEERLEKISSKDSLTGFYNRDFFLRIVDETLQKSTIDKNAVVFAKINLDCFKNITDIYGLKFGDEVIGMVSKIIQNTVGKFGSICRLNCDQFMVLFADMKLIDAVHIINLAQNKIKNQTITLPDNSTTYLDSHASVTKKHNDEDNSQTLLKRTNIAIKGIVGTTKTINIA